MKKYWKTALLILLILSVLLILTGCSAYYKPEGSNWVFQVW